MNKVPIVEIFSTVQGEGPGLGLPSLFVRVGGCDLRCRFRGIACDTPYAVYTPSQLAKEHPELQYGYTKWNLYTVEELVAAIEAQPITHMVFSGGHPLLYQEQFEQVIRQLSNKGKYTFEFETQGTIRITIRLAFWQNVVFNVSVKLKSSNQEDGYDQKRINIDALKSFPEDRSFYKFVIVDPVEDLKEIREILSIRELPVYVMPEGMTREEVIKNSPAVVQLAIENNFRFSPREHVVIWDTKKGV